MFGLGFRFEKRSSDWNYVCHVVQYPRRRPELRVRHVLQYHMRTLAVTLLLAGSAHAAVELTPDNFDKEMAGKSAFIKFLAPW